MASKRILLSGHDSVCGGASNDAGRHGGAWLCASLIGPRGLGGGGVRKQDDDDDGQMGTTSPGDRQSVSIIREKGLLRISYVRLRLIFFLSISIVYV